MRTSIRYSLTAVLLSALLAGSLSAQSTVRRSASGSSSSSSSSSTSSSSASQVRRGSSQSSSTKSEAVTTQPQNRTTTTTQSQNTRTSTSGSSSASSGTTTTRRTSSAGAASATRTTSTDGSQTRTSVTGSSTGSTFANGSVSGTTATGTSSQTATNVTRRGLSSVSSSSSSTSGNTRNSAVSASEYRVTNNNVERIAPRERAYQSYSTPRSFYGSDPHYYGWRVESMPPSYKRVRYYGIDYYLYNDVYYRPYGSSYIVCRPPVGVVVTKSIKTPFGRVTFSFYTNSYRSYNGWDSYSRYIDEQNRIIAQNNAYIAAQNRAIAMNLNYARSSYDLAYQLGLAQSYAYANWDYYYDDGVFYIINRNGRYEVIVPPAGALVDELPDDYETIIINGMELYRVDDTVYRTVLVSGRPYLEVLGQMYGSLASRYSIYR